MATRAVDTTPNATLIQRILPRSGSRTRLGVALQVALGVAFLAALAQVRIQLGPVPFTGQTLGVLLLGTAYGVGLGALTTGAYVALGALGLPIFTGWAGGVAHLMGPTGGYLIGFVLAAALLGWLARRGWDRSYARTVAAMLLAEVAIYVPGLIWLHAVIAGSWATALALGLVPFLLGDALKLLVAVGLLPTAWRLLGER
ncbi:MAG TPA: biotin transporter BioY [Trueperaceae bacterium]|nr:biotin transporter BioY [Trueperaceae bacterium]